MSLLFDLSNIQPQRNDSLESRRYGKLFYGKNFLETASEALQKLYSKITPTEVKYDFARELFEVTALCDEFDPVEPNYMIPYYMIEVKVHRRKTGTGKAYYLNFAKLEEQ